MDKETLKSSLQEILLKGRGEKSRKDPAHGDSTSHYGHESAGEGMTGPEGRPIEPQAGKASGIARLKWVFFVLALLYVFLSAYHGLILTSMGQYLVVEHPAENSDLIVCLGGGSVDRGLAAADAYGRGLAPKLFVTRQAIPDGYGNLKERGVSYPESRELMITMLKDLGVPGSAILTSDTPSENTVMEAALVSRIVKEKNYSSVILVTSPVHSRRAWLVFRKAMAGEDVRIIVNPSPYSDFNPQEWWKNPSSLRGVVLEYQKLVYYFFKGYL